MNDDNKGTMMLEVVFVRSVICGRSGNWKAQVKVSRISKRNKMTWRTIYKGK